MHNRINYFLLLAIPAILFLTSCNKSNQAGKFVPKNASVVFIINSSSLTSKLPWDEIKQNQVFQEMYADTATDAVVKAALDNPENTGIDLKNDMVFYVQKDSLGGYIVLQGKIKDADKFRNFYSSAIKGSISTDKNGVNAVKNEKMITTWNKERFAILFDAPQMNQANMNKFPMPMDSAMTEPVMPMVKRNLDALSSTLFNLEEKNSLANNEKFTDLLKTKGDVYFWMNIGAIGSEMPAMGTMALMNMSKLYEGALLTGSASFNDGKINVDFKSYAGAEMTSLFKKYEGSKISSDMVKRIPSKDPAFLFAMNFKPQGLVEFLKLTGMDGFANMGAGYLGFTLDDFVRANKGDILLTVSDIRKDSSGKTDADFLFSAAINDKASFGKLIDAGKKMGKSRFNDSMPVSLFYNSTDNYFTIGNKQASVNTFGSKESNNSYDFWNKISAHPIGVFVNFQTVMRTMNTISQDTFNLAMHTASLQMWDNMVAYGGEFKDGGVQQYVEINLVDKKVNSLKQLNTYSGIMGSIEKRRKAMRGIDSNMWADSTVVIKVPGK